MARLALIALVLALAVTWQYAPSLRGGFVYEDATWTDACAPPAELPVPIARLGMRASWCGQLALGHTAPAFRLVSLGLHLVVIGLVGALAWTLTGQAWASGLAAAFFGVNAVAVESVAYLSSRGELLAAIGVIGACLAALHRRWILAGLLVAFGWAGKEMAVVAVMLVPLCLWYSRRSRVWAWVAVLAGVALGLAILWHTSGWWNASWGQPRPALGPWALLQATAIARVVTLSVLPFGQTVDYDYLRVPLFVQVCAAVFLAAGIGWAWTQRANRLLLCGVAWVVCAVAPRLLVVTPASVFTEHHFYLPLVGMALILASVLRDAPGGTPCPAR